MSSPPRNSFVLGRAFGIPVVLNPLLMWLAVAILVAALLTGRSPVLWLVGVALLMCLVLLHELGHSLTARHFGVEVSHISLTPLGGVAWMSEIPRDVRIETLVALAGPAVNLALAALASPLLLLGGWIAGFAGIFIYINLALGLFNLVPAFPMDGGRVLRAQLARNGDWLGATERAVSIGKGLMLVLGLAGLFTGNFMLPILAVFLWAMGQRELFAMRLREMGAAWPFGGFQAPGPAPGPAQPTAASGRGSHGFSDAEIERLERHHGPLRRDWREEP